MKKIISAGLAAILAVSALATTAFAADAELKGNSSISLKATTLIPTLKVTLPKTLAFVVNPYKMDIDKTTGKAFDTAKGVAENKVEGKTIVPMYGVTGTGSDATPNTAWQVINSSGVPLTAKLYAKVGVTDAANKTIIVDLSGSSPVDAATGEALTEDDAKLKQVKLLLKAKGDADAALKVPLRTTAATAWDAATVVSVPKITTSLDLTLDDTSAAVKGANCAEAWSGKEAVTLGVVFNFDFFVE